MAKKGKKKKSRVLADSITTSIAAELSSKVGSTVKGRDSLTRVTSPVKGIDTHSRQWNRWSP